MQGIVIVSPAPLEDALKANSLVPEFASSDKFIRDEYALRCNNEAVASVISVALDSGTPVGYLISYDRYKDGSFYVWMAGVAMSHRNRGVLRLLMRSHAEYARRCVDLVGSWTLRRVSNSAFRNLFSVQARFFEVGNQNTKLSS
jgi:ribosomal protein S18 acetylase RimI-like enzyme